MNSFLEIFFLAWAFISLIPLAELVPLNWTPEERRVYEQLRLQDCGVLSKVIPAQRLQRRITGGRKSILMSQPWMAPQVTSSPTWWIIYGEHSKPEHSKPDSQVVPGFRQPFERITRNCIWSYTSEMASWVTYSNTF